MTSAGEGMLAAATPGSAALYRQAAAHMPGGVSASLKTYEPYPLYMERAAGPYLYDVDGSRYVDYLLVYGSMLLGHGHPAVLAAIREQIDAAGTLVFGTPHRGEIQYAEEIRTLYPSMALVRFTNSGLEGTLLALRIATAATGRPLIGKFEGHYHGAHGRVLVSVNPPLEQAGAAVRPRSLPDALDVRDELLAQTVVLPFNDWPGTLALLDEFGDRMAAIIMEPFEGGYIAADPEFLQNLRAETTRRGIVLIYDEVKTGFRMAPGGAQEVLGIAPDLTVLGKVLGGGFPIGAVGGRRDLMELLTPRHGGLHLFHSGTFNGHPLALAAGRASLRVLREPGVYERLAGITGKLRRGMESILAAHGVAGTTVGQGSVFNLVLTDHPIRSYRDVATGDSPARRALDQALIGLGVFSKPLNRFSLSIAHTEADIDFTLDRFQQACDVLIKEGDLHRS